MRRKPGLSVRLVGTKGQLEFVLAKFEGNFSWKSSGHFYPRINQRGFYSYYLDNFSPLTPEPGEDKSHPQPSTLSSAEVRHSRKMAFWASGKHKSAKRGRLRVSVVKYFPQP